jgi:hypothetical protein
MAGVENRAGKVSLGLLLRHEQGYSLEIKGYGKQPKRKLLTHRKCQMAGKSPQQEKRTRRKYYIPQTTAQTLGKQSGKLALSLESPQPHPCP